MADFSGCATKNSLESDESVLIFDVFRRLGWLPGNSLAYWMISVTISVVCVGYGALFVLVDQFAHSHADEEAHLQSAEVLTRQISSGKVQLPLPDGLHVEARWIHSESLKSAMSSVNNTISSNSGDDVVLSTRFYAKNPSSGELQILEIQHFYPNYNDAEYYEWLLMLASAGASILLTSLLFRFVFNFGLIQPLSRLQRQIDLLGINSLGEHKIDVASQPLELRSLASSFNSFQDKIFQSLSRERRFVEDVAHQLRAPITVIDCQAQSLAVENLNDLSEKRILRIQKESRRLGSLVRQVLDFARADSGVLRFQLEKHPISSILLESYDRLYGLSPGRIFVSPCDDQPEGLFVSVDFERVVQCMSVLVENSVSYTNGNIFLGFRADATSISLFVQDEGPGIPVSERSSVVQRFVRGSTSKGTKGSGIGLASVSELMSAMGGHLVIDDAPLGGCLMRLAMTHCSD